MMSINNINIYLGIIIIILNAIPFLTGKTKYYGLTLPISILLALIRIFFVN
jgi:hypothetical protein